MCPPDATETEQQWPPEKEKEFELLLAEAEQASKQISSYLDLQTKLIGILFPVLGTIVAIIFAVDKGESLSPRNIAKILLTLSLIGSFGILQTAITYGSTLTYIDYKKRILGPRLMKLLNLDYEPLAAVHSFTTTGVGDAVLFATYCLTIGITFLNIGVLCYCWRLAGSSCALRFAIAGGFVAIISSFIAQVRLRRAMQAVGVIRST